LRRRDLYFPEIIRMFDFEIKKWRRSPIYLFLRQTIVRTRTILLPQK
jgi:hypothetical protein